MSRGVQHDFSGPHPQRWLILGVICLAQLTVLLDNTVLNVAIPALTGELHAATADIQWMINAYSLVQSGLLLTAGSAADLPHCPEGRGGAPIGRKKMLIAGLVLFGAGSLAAGLAGSTGQLVAARAGMGVGGALFLLTQHLQLVLGYGPLEAGLRTAPLALTVVALNFTGLSASWATRLGTPLAIALGMLLMSPGLVSIAVLDASGYGGTLLGLPLIGAGCAIANPAMAHAVMSAIPPEKAGVGAGINGTLAEFGNGLGVAVLGAVLSSWVAAGKSLSAGLGAGQLVGAAAVVAGGFVAAGLLRKAEKNAA
ncbi:MFS transporter [Streptomyces sp. NPDC090499]|uniref:MFS transporter n=1 Tax=Streptomyces sp. NPDC090499 TaxID=3365965 RepID=UPI00380C0CE6